MGNQSCLICTASLKATYLGIEACRSCAEFFKRTVIAGRKFICRQGKSQCEIRRHDKYMCRSCRYDKCVKFNMKYDIPSKRKPRKKLISMIDVQAQTLDQISPRIALPSSRTHRAVRECEDPWSEQRLTPSVRDSLIDRMGAEYKASFCRRLWLEKEYVISHNLTRFTHPTQELYIANFNSFYELFRITINDSSALLQRVFHEFDSLPIGIQVTLFKHFVTKLFMIECFYYSARIIKDSPNMFMASLFTCADMNNVEEFMKDDIKFVRNDAFRTIVRGYTRDYSDVLKSMAKLVDFTEREFHALIILNYCNVDCSLHLPEHIVTIVRKIRSKVFGELQDYYKNELKLHDFSKRLGNLMILSHVAGETGVLMNEEMRMYAIMFDVYSDDKLFCEFFT